MTVFEYNKNLYNVLEVSKANYDECNIMSSILTHNSGNDSILIKSKGHNYFICGIPTHCNFNMKLDIEASSSSTAIPSPALLLLLLLAMEATLCCHLPLIFVVSQRPPPRELLLQLYFFFFYY